MNVSASYLHTFLTMANFFDEQYLKNEWNDFINSNYTTGCEDLTLFSFLNYFVSHGILKPNPQLTTFFQNLSVRNLHADQISTSVCINYINLQSLLRGQDFSIKAEKTRSEYKEIKALY